MWAYPVLISKIFTDFCFTKFDLKFIPAIADEVYIISLLPVLSND